MGANARDGDPREGAGVATRRRLIAAAVQIFGERGYHAVGTRELADAAGANLAAIPYHFGGKDGLYQAAAEHIAAAGRAALAPLFDRMASTSVESLARDQLAELTRALFRDLTRGLVGLGEDSARAAFIVREQTDAGPAFDILYEGYIRDVHEAVTQLVGAARGLGRNTARAALEAHALVGTVLGFVVARQTLCRRTGWDGYNRRRLHEIEEAVVEVALRALGLADDAARKPRMQGGAT
jgi:TetR/AcrR family transcriptional regulator, regulator of cefoperazone and chloramphenicol sensitivity